MPLTVELSVADWGYPLNMPYQTIENHCPTSSSTSESCLCVRPSGSLLWGCIKPIPNCTKLCEVCSPNIELTFPQRTDHVVTANHNCLKTDEPSSVQPNPTKRNSPELPPRDPGNLQGKASLPHLPLAPPSCASGLAQVVEHTMLPFRPAFSILPWHFGSFFGSSLGISFVSSPPTSFWTFALVWALVLVLFKGDLTSSLRTGGSAWRWRGTLPKSPIPAVRLRLLQRHLSCDCRLRDIATVIAQQIFNTAAGHPHKSVNGPSAALSAYPLPMNMSSALSIDWSECSLAPPPARSLSRYQATGDNFSWPPLISTKLATSCACMFPKACIMSFPGYSTASFFFLSRLLPASADIGILLL